MPIHSTYTSAQYDVFLSMTLCSSKHLLLGPFSPLHQHARNNQAGSLSYPPPYIFPMGIWAKILA